MAVLKLNINGEQREVDVDPTTPLLWVLRDHLNLVGTKYGCGIGQCGACTVHFNGNPIRSCSIPVSAIADNQIVTIEGLSENGDHPLQLAWKELDVSQCGYCQAGQLMAAAAFLEINPNPTDDDIDTSITNICRCGTHVRIRKAIHLAANNSNVK